MKKIIILAMASLMATNSAMATTDRSIESYMIGALNKLQQSGYEVSLVNGERLNLNDISKLTGQELVLTGQGLKGIEVHVKGSALDEQVPSLILAAYRPNKERIAMTKLKFSLEGSYEQNKINFLRTISVFLKQVEDQTYAQNGETSSERLPASINNGLLIALGVAAALVIVPMVLYVHIQVKNSNAGRLEDMQRAGKINEVIKQMVIKHNIETRAAAKTSAKAVVKAMSGKRAKVVTLLLTLGLGINELAQN